MYELADAPVAISMGETVEKFRSASVWERGCLPFHVDPNFSDEFKAACPEHARRYADRIQENVPIWKERVTVRLAPYSIGGSTSSGSGPAVAPAPADNAEAAGTDPPAPAESTANADDPSPAAPHCLAHFPHNPNCDACKRANIRQRSYARRGAAEARHLHAVAPCDSLSTDAMITSESADDETRMSADGDICVHRFRDKYSGFSCAAPQKDRSHQNYFLNFRKFVGPRNSAFILVKPDAARELVGAIREMKWHSSASLENRWPHNTAHESIRAVLKRTIRACVCQSGFPENAVHFTMSYACAALEVAQPAPTYEWAKDVHGALLDLHGEKANATCWEVHFGSPFTHLLQPFGSLCWYLAKD